MGLELRRDANQQLRSNWWYGRYMINGERRFVNLGIEVKGSVPKNIRTQGDVAFECSRTLADAKLKELIEKAQNKKTAAHHLQELYEIKAGEELTQITLAEMAEQWNLLPTKKKRCPLRTDNQLATIRQFREFMEAKFPQAKTMSQITRKMALSWMKDLDDMGMAGATYNTKLSLSKGIFEKLGSDAGVLTNPFNGIPFHETNTMQPAKRALTGIVVQASIGRTTASASRLRRTFRTKTMTPPALIMSPLRGERSRDRSTHSANVSLLSISASTVPFMAFVKSPIRTPPPANHPSPI